MPACSATRPEAADPQHPSSCFMEPTLGGLGQGLMLRVLLSCPQGHVIVEAVGGAGAP